MLHHALAPVNLAAAARIAVPRRLPGMAGVALTFDDGPHPEGTPAMLEQLERYGAKATFFLVGEQVARRPALAARILAAGHHVALHGHRHRLQLRLTAREVAADCERGLGVLQDATGVPVRRHRPPYGIYSPAGLAAARHAGLEPLLWSRWGKDWRRLTTPARIADRATRALLPGDVILLHDADFYSAHGSHRRTFQALAIILDRLAKRKVGTVLTV